MTPYWIVVVACVAAAIIAVYMADSGAIKRKRDYDNYDGYDPEAGSLRVGDRRPGLFD
jgi:hypothetical protein